MSEERTRRLSAIMFTDMVGYTALMQEDESRATTLRDRHRTVLREGIEARQGEIVQFYGDGTLSVFPSAVQAADAAVDIQRGFRLDPAIPVRIGLHIGDIVHDQDGVHGDGVNVAARVQGLAVPGGGVQTPTTVRKPTESSEAYSRYLRGLHCWNQWTPNTIKDALGHFHDALALDPDFALAHALVARCYAQLGAQGQLRSEEAHPAAQEAAQRAIELNPEIAEAHVSLGLVKLFFDWDLAEARSCLERAIELNPGSAEVRYWAGTCYLASGHFDELLETAQVAASLDPLSLLTLDALGRAHVVAGRPRDGLIHYDRALEIEPTFRSSIEGRAFAYDGLGEHDRAIEESLRYRALTPGGMGGLGPATYFFARAGRTEEALGCLAELEQLERTSPQLTLHIDFTIALTALGRLDEAVERLERAIEARVGAVVFVRHIFAWENLSRDPRMDEILGAVGL